MCITTIKLNFFYATLCYKHESHKSNMHKLIKFIQLQGHNTTKLIEK